MHQIKHIYMMYNKVVSGHFNPTFLRTVALISLNGLKDEFSSISRLKFLKVIYCCSCFH